MPGSPEHFATSMELGGVALRPARHSVRRPADQRSREILSTRTALERRTAIAQAEHPPALRPRPEPPSPAARRRARNGQPIWAEFRDFRSGPTRDCRRMRGAGLRIQSRPARRPAWPPCGGGCCRLSRRHAGTSTSRSRETTSGPGRALPSGSRSDRCSTSTKPDVIVCFDDDLLADHPAAVGTPASSPRTATRRGPDEPAVRRREPFSVTGAAADHRLCARRGSTDLPSRASCRDQRSEILRGQEGRRRRSTGTFHDGDAVQRCLPTTWWTPWRSVL